MQLCTTRPSHVAPRVRKRRPSANTHAEDQCQGVLLFDRERRNGTSTAFAIRFDVPLSHEKVPTMQLEPLAFEEKANRRYKNATPTKLYSTAEVSFLKWLLQRTDTLPHMKLQPLPAAQTSKHVNACCFTGKPPLSLSSLLHQSTANLLVTQTAVQCGLCTFHVHPLRLPLSYMSCCYSSRKWLLISGVVCQR